MAVLVSEFIENVKRRAYIPDNQEAFEDTDILAFADQELQETVYPEVINLDADYFVLSQFLDIKDSLGNLNFPSGIVPVPERSFARAVREIKLVDKTQFQAGNFVKYNVPWFPMEDEDLYGLDRRESSPTSVSGYFITNDGIRFMGNLREQDEMIELRFIPAPAKLYSSSTLHAEVGAVAWDSITEQVTFTISGGVGADFNSFCADGAVGLFDIYRKSSGSIMLADITMTRADSGGNSLLTTGNLNAGDLVTLAAFQPGGFTGINNTISAQYDKDIMILPAKRQSYIPLPQSLVNLLEIAVASRYFESQGDVEALQLIERRYNKQWKMLRKIYDNRNRGEGKKWATRRGLASLTRNTRWGVW